MTDNQAATEVAKIIASTIEQFSVIAAGTADVRVVAADTLPLDGSVHYGWGRYTATAA